MGAISAALATLGGCTAVRCIMDRPGRREAEYCHGRVRLRLFWNEGAAFSLPLPPKLLPAASGAMLGALWHQRKRAPIGVGLLLGGGLSNLYERVWRGRVCDYIQFPKAPGRLRHYIFNLADFAILAGGLCLLAGRKKQDSQNP